jgi:hypothetical protein
MTRNRPPHTARSAASGRKMVLPAMALAAVVGAITLPAWASPLVSGTQIRDFTRITFEWPTSTKIQTSQQGRELRITFDQQADAPDFSRVLTRLPAIVQKASLQADKRTVVLTLDKPYRVRSFISGRMNGVDLLPPQTQAPVETPTPAAVEATAPTTSVTATPPPAPKPAPKPVEAKPAEAKPAPVAEPAAVAWKTAPKPKAKPAVPVPEPVAPAPEPVAATSPAMSAPVEKPAVVQAAVEAPAPAPAPAAAPPEPAAPAAAAEPVPVPEAAPAQSPSPAAPEVPAPAEPEEPVPATTTASTAAPATKLTLSAAPADAMKLPVSIIREGDIVSLTFPWTQRTAAAVFRRGEYFWVVFDRTANMQINGGETAGDLLNEIQSDVPQGHTVLRLRTSRLLGVRIRQPEGSMSWQLIFSPQAQWPDTIPTIQAKTEPPLPPHLLIGALEAAPAVRLVDPVVGDEIVVVPSYTPGQGIAPARQMAELQLLSSAQGIAVVPQIDGVSVEQQRNGLRLGTKDGLNLSSDLPILGGGKTDGSNDAPMPSMFAVADWPSVKDPVHVLQARLLPLVAEEGMVANEARRQLATGYMAHGLMLEALGVLENIRTTDRDYYIRERLAGLSGVANFMNYRIGEAARDFTAPELQGNEEADYWRTILAELTGRSDELFDYPRFNARYMKQYSDEVRRRLSLIAADRLVARKRFNEALKVLDDVRASNLVNPTIAPALDYLLAEILAQTGQVKKATELWEKISENLENRYWRARAEYALTNLKLSTGEITELEALIRLDRLRILWRDDPIELQILQQVGDLQLKHKQYREGLRTLREITQAYPNTTDAFQAAQRMAEIFVYLFNDEGAKEMKPLEALALYYEFKELTPVEAAGDLMIRNLADRLAEVDLLDRAAALLEHQVRYRLQGEERSRVGARLALIYLLNRQPQQALSVLELTGYGANPEELQRTRALLTSRALADLKEGARAIDLLEDDPSFEAQLLKLDINWDLGNWPEVARVGESVLSARRDATAVLNESEMGALLKLAVAYSFEGAAEHLRYLREYFLPLVKDGPHKDVFLFLTNDTPIAPENLAQLAQNLTQMQSFLGRWRTQIHEQGLSEAVK